jgi:uncharacterized GH25 family protein
MTHGLRRAFSLTTLLALAGTAVAAHDMWIEPTGFKPVIGRTVGFRLRVGQDFQGDPLPRDPNLIEQFIVADGAATTPVVGRDGADPAGLMRVASPGLYVVGYHSKPSPVVLQAPKFNEYLTQEGLEAIAAVRARKGQSNAEAREVFVRCAKSLLLAGPAEAAQHDRVLGLPLELVADRSPYMMTTGQSLGVRLLYRDQPLAGALVVALNQRDPLARVAARSDKAGHVQLKLSQPGPWLIKAVHMIPAPAGSDSQWASFWASLTFELPDASPRAVTSSPSGAQ